MTIYEIRDDKKYYKNNKHVSKKSVLEALKPYQLAKLNENKICKVRDKQEQLVSQQKTYQDSIKQPNINKFTVNELKPRELKIIEKVKSKYKVERIFYIRKGYQDELWRKNPKGYWNFVCILSNTLELTVNKAILEDIKMQKKEASKINKESAF